ncbi:MAG: DUF4163 domain-containing protein [Firmicutes bacterium]|nr:DUF4163 domain-containing protein [Bacillota bacterium]
MKKKVVLAAVAVTGMMFSNTAFADGNASVTVNGNEVIYDQKPIIEDGRVLVPMRATFEALGATIEWDDATKTVRASNGTDNISIEVGKNELIREGKDNITLDVAAKIVNGRTLVPLRAVSEAFSADVSWDNQTKTVSIITNDGINFIDNSSYISEENNEHDFYKEFKADDGTVLYEQYYDYDRLSDKTAEDVKEKIYADLKEQGDEYFNRDIDETGESKNFKTVKEAYDKYPDQRPSIPYLSVYDFELTEESDKYISYAGTMYVFLGGAHGMEYLKCSVYDAKTGEKLSLSDITGKSEDEIRKIRTEKLNEMVKNEPDKFYSSDMTEEISALEDEVFDFYIEEGRIMVTLNQPYLIAPYVSGFIKFEFDRI